ncbi:hypothetical protein HPP92_005451 [Vanilla planifolia]|uniref:Uncharacterized protein n=1 Tax=Vanilla planifolia TaxID=51239 RepID=A0A835RYN5_VANPL|nr:hypothetical protein HPP92_005451 [Vanilla planifolia]
MELPDGDMSKALVALTPDAASIPMPKLKNVSRLHRTPSVCSETAQSTEPPEASCNSQYTGQLCDKSTCFSCNSVRESQGHIVRGTLLIPCRTAMKGSFPLNGTYFQVNEVFADHISSRNPIDVPRDWIWNLPRRTVYFGTSVSQQKQFSNAFGGFVCVRGFDRATRAPRPLYARLHFPASKAPKNRKVAATTAAAKVEE